MPRRMNDSLGLGMYKGLGCVAVWACRVMGELATGVSRLACHPLGVTGKRGKESGAKMRLSVRAGG